MAEGAPSAIFIVSCSFLHFVQFQKESLAIPTTDTPYIQR